MPNRLTPLPRSLGAAFTRRQAQALGVLSRRLTHPDVLRLAPGYYTRAPLQLAPGDRILDSEAHPAWHWQQQQRAFAHLIGPLLPPGLFFTGRTAAALWRLAQPFPVALRARGPGAAGLRFSTGIAHPQPSSSSSRARAPAPPANLALSIGGLDLGSCSRSERVRAQGFTLQRAHAKAIRVVKLQRGFDASEQEPVPTPAWPPDAMPTTGMSQSTGLIPVTDPASTWAMLAPKLAHTDRVALGDSVIREPRYPGTRRLERAPHATLAELERLAMIPGRHGGPALRELLPYLSPHAASAPESHLRLCLQAWGAPEPHLDYDVYNAAGVLIGATEIAYPRYRIAIEYEGDHHRTDPRQWNRDIEKARAYQEAGWLVLRVTSEMLYRKPAELRALVFRALRQRGWKG